MVLATFKSVCIDAMDASVMQDFWAKALDYEVETLDDGDSVLRGRGAGEEVWINTVPEAKTVWHRVHLDLRAESLEPFADLEQVSGDGEFPWTTFLDPEGGEFCVFTYDEPTSHRLKDIVVQALDHATISDLVGRRHAAARSCTTTRTATPTSTTCPAPRLESFDFVPTKKPKTVKNRIHWDVTLNEGVTVDDLVAAGASVLRAQDDEISWTVMADPEGNEFCVFASLRAWT